MQKLNGCENMKSKNIIFRTYSCGKITHGIIIFPEINGIPESKCVFGTWTGLL